MKRNSRFFSMPGLSLLILILLSLCLVTFSLLSLSGSLADEKLSKKTADRTTAYYQASDTANDLLATLDTALAGYLKQASLMSDPEKSWEESCPQLTDLIDGSTLENDIFSFSVPVTDRQILLVNLILNYPEAPSDTMYRITVWKIVNTGEWHPDTTQNLYQFDSNADHS